VDDPTVELWDRPSGAYTIVRYLDARGAPAPRSRAVVVEHVEYDAGHRETGRMKWIAAGARPGVAIANGQKTTDFS
jgi:hypothetical protein